MTYGLGCHQMAMDYVCNIAGIENGDFVLGAEDSGKAELPPFKSHVQKATKIKLHQEVSLLLGLSSLILI